MRKCESCNEGKDVLPELFALSSRFRRYGRWDTHDADLVPIFRSVNEIKVELINMLAKLLGSSILYTGSGKRREGPEKVII